MSAGDVYGLCPRRCIPAEHPSKLVCCFKFAHMEVEPAFSMSMAAGDLRIAAVPVRSLSPSFTPPLCSDGPRSFGECDQCALMCRQSKILFQASTKRQRELCYKHVSPCRSCCVAVLTTCISGTRPPHTRLVRNDWWTSNSHEGRCPTSKAALPYPP